MVPAILTKMPAKVIAMAMGTRADVGTANKGVINETPHIAIATKTAIMGGGILSSRDGIVITMSVEAELSLV